MTQFPQICGITHKPAHDRGSLFSSNTRILFTNIHCLIYATSLYHYQHCPWANLKLGEYYFLKVFWIEAKPFWTNFRWVKYFQRLHGEKITLYTAFFTWHHFSSSSWSRVWIARYTFILWYIVLAPSFVCKSSHICFNC